MTEIASTDDSRRHGITMTVLFPIGIGATPLALDAKDENHEMSQPDRAVRTERNALPVGRFLAHSWPLTSSRRSLQSGKNSLDQLSLCFWYKSSCSEMSRSALTGSERSPIESNRHGIL